MSVSARTQENTGLSADHDREGDYILDLTRKGVWRIYRENDGYGAGGQTLGKGKVVRDFDGWIVEKNTKEEAREYVRNLIATEKADIERARAARARGANNA